MRKARIDFPIVNKTHSFIGFAENLCKCFVSFVYIYFKKCRERHTERRTERKERAGIGRRRGKKSAVRPVQANDRVHPNEPM